MTKRGVLRSLWPSKEPSGSAEEAQSRSAERYRRSLLSGTAALFARGLVAGSTLVSVPLVLDHLGRERFGLWMTLMALVAMLSFADLGIGNGLITLLAQASGADDRASAQRLLTSATFALTGITSALVAVVIAVVPTVDWASLFNVTGEPATAEAGQATLLFAIVFLLALPLTISQKVHLSYQEGYVNAFWQGAGAIMGLVGIIIALHTGGGVPAVVLAATGGPLLALLGQTIFLFHNRRWLIPRLQSWNSQDLRRLSRLGLSFFVMQTVMAVAFASDNLIIANVLGPEDVAQYAVHAQPFIWIGGIAGVFLLPLWPAYGESMSRGDLEWSRSTLRKSIAVALVATVAPGLLLSVFGDRAIRLWVGNAVPVSRSLLLGFTIWITVAAVGSALSIILNAAGKVRFQVATAVLMGVAALCAKVIGAGRWGLPGVIWGTATVYVVVSLLPTILYTRKWVRRELRSRS